MSNGTQSATGTFLLQPHQRGDADAKQLLERASADTPPETLKMRCKIEGRDDVLKTMAGALEAFAATAAN